MGAPTTIPRSFRQKLRAELDRREWGVRTLARKMADRDNTPQRVESIRRQLKRYLSDSDPVHPSPATREAIEATLELERGSLDDEDEEADPVSIDDLLRLRVNSLVREALKSNDPAARIAASTAGSSNNGG